MSATWRWRLSPELVTVLETADTFALSLAKASLDEAGIAYVVDGDDVPPVHRTLPGGSRPWRDAIVGLFLPHPGCARVRDRGAGRKFGGRATTSRSGVPGTNWLACSAAPGCASSEQSCASVHGGSAPYLR